MDSGINDMILLKFATTLVDFGIDDISLLEFASTLVSSRHMTSDQYNPD
jgi:hypothetical protein